MWDDEAGYDYSDPKHPTYAERMYDYADQKRKEAKENPQPQEEELTSES